MADGSYIIRKCNEFIENIDSMDEQEKTNAMVFIAEVQKHHFNEVMDLVNRTTEINEQLLEENEKIRDSINHFHRFIEDANLGKQFSFYSKGKKVF